MLETKGFFFNTNNCINLTKWQPNIAGSEVYLGQTSYSHFHSERLSRSRAIVFSELFRLN